MSCNSSSPIAELRAEVMASPEAGLPSPEEEIQAVLPADVLASLDEPIDGDEDEEPVCGEAGTRHRRWRRGRHRGASGNMSGTGAALDCEGTGAHAKGTTSGGIPTADHGLSGPCAQHGHPRCM